MLQNRRGWTNDEDKAIITLVRKYGTKNWAEISQKMSSKYGIQNRTGKQCRERWHNHLDPQVNKQAWTSKQQKTMFDAHQRYGNKWTEIAKLFHGRTDNDIKNHFYSMLRRSLRRKQHQKNKAYQAISFIKNILQQRNRECKQIVVAVLAEALFQFSKSKSPLDLSTIIDSNERRRLQQLIQKLAIYNEQYESGQLLKKDSKKSRDQDCHGEIRPILIINPKENYKKNIESQSNFNKSKSQEGNNSENSHEYQKGNYLREIGSDFMGKNGDRVKKYKVGQRIDKLMKSSQLVGFQNIPIQEEEGIFDIKKNKNSKKISETIKEEPKSRIRGRPHKIPQLSAHQQPQIERFNFGIITNMQKKFSSFQQANLQPQFDIPAIFQMPDLHIMERRSSSYNEHRRSVSSHFLSNSTPTMDAKLFIRTPKEPTPSMFLSKNIQTYEWKANNEELDMIVNETRQAINRKIK